MTIVRVQIIGLRLRCAAAALLCAALIGCAALAPARPATAADDSAIAGVDRAAVVDDPPAAPDPQPEPEPESEPDPESEAAAASAQAAAEAAEPRRSAVDAVLAALSTEQRVGQLFMPAFPVDQRGRGLLAVDDNVRRLMQQIQPGGVLLVGLNVDSTEQLTRLIQELQQNAALPLLIATDHEGGAVSRISASGKIPATSIPSPHVVGAVADPALAYRLGAVIGRELRSLGIQVNFAPVADLRTNPGNTVIGERSFGSDPEVVGRIVAALVRGMQQHGVAAVLKHFPGHGDTYEDSHYEAATVRHSRQRLQTVEMVPFRYGIDAGAIGVMTAHISVPAVTGDRTPATLSSELLGPILRSELGFGSLVFSDALNMHALTRYYHRSRVALQAFEAGVDVLVHPERPLEAYQTVLEAVQSGRISAERLERSVRAILEVKWDLGLLSGAPDAAEARYDSAQLTVLGSAEHQAVADEILLRYRRQQSGAQQ